MVLVAPAALLAGAGSYRDALAMFTPDAYIEHIKVLASDAYEGRGTGQPGNDRAADYIAEHFKEFGLKPAGLDGSWFQPFDVRKGKKLVPEDAKFEIDGLDQQFEVKKEWTPFPFSAIGNFDGPVAFLGYGIDAPDDGVDDYGDFDVRDKVVMVFRYEPKGDSDKAKIGGAEPSKHALFATKASVAAKHGAKALLIVNPPGHDAKDDLFRFNRDGSRETYEVPMVHIKREIADTLLKRGGQPNLESLEESLKDRKRHSAALAGVRVSVKTGMVSNEVKTKNVLALLEGDGAPDEYVVVGAHFDHLGIAPRMFGGSDETKYIHNGADDNASGTAGVIELARVLSASPKLRRNILFICFSGEEMGLLGSQHFVENPTIPLNQIKAMMNFDMIGRFSDEAVMIYGVPTAAEFEPLLDRVSSETGLPYKLGKSLPGNSDHASFQAKKIPVIFPFTGLHKQYHKPEDDWELIKPDGATQVLKFSYLVLVDIANMKEGPTWKDPRKSGTSSKEDDSVADSAKGDKSDPHAAAAGDSDAAPPPMPKVRLGVVPDYSEDGKPGLRLNDVTPGSAAELAGIKGGDRIVKIGDVDVRGIETYMLALGKYSPGDEVEIVVERDGERVTVKAKLTGPPQKKPAD